MNLCPLLRRVTVGCVLQTKLVGEQQDRGPRRRRAQPIHAALREDIQRSRKSIKLLILLLML